MIEVVHGSYHPGDGMLEISSDMRWNSHSVAQNGGRVDQLVHVGLHVVPRSEGQRSPSWAGRARLNGLVGSVHDAAAVNVRLPSFGVS